MVTAAARLPGAELRARARRIRLVVTDCDGVLTDAGVYYSERGEELKRFSLRDGMGVELLRNAGVATGILTREDSPIVRRRAEKLRLEHYWPGVKDKLLWLPAVRELAAEGELAFIGDDVNDLLLLQAVGRQGLSACPADAIDQVRDSVTVCCSHAGGHGAFREFADLILRLRREDSP